MRNWFLVGAVAAFVAVALGAFGAHGLKGRLTPDHLALFETGVRYQMYHALALMALAGMAGRLPDGLVRQAGLSLTAGILIFSGSLYALALSYVLTPSGQRWLGAVTPLGGVAFLFGWLTLIRGGLALSKGRS